MLTSMIAIFVLLVLSAFFSGSETALTATSRPLMHQLARRGNGRAQIINNLYKKKERMIGALLLGNNLVNIMASALATGALISIYGESGVIYATLGMTFLVLIFAEILPKSYAFRNPDRVSLALAPAVNLLVVVLTPVTHLINLVVRMLMKIFGIDFHAEDGFSSTSDRLRGAIELHAATHASARQERAMLRSVLDLSEVQIGEIMIHRKNIAMLDAGQSTQSLVAAILDSPYTRIPLWRGDQDNIVGVLHAKALFRAVQAQKDNASLADLNITKLANKPWFVPETTSLIDQLHAFRRRHEHISLVVDEYGTFMGIVTLEDILEEIVGEIADEHDVTVTGARPQTDGSYIVEGTTTIRDLNRQFDWSLPDEDAATVAGLILHESRRIPEMGQTFMFFGFRFQVLERKRHQLTSIRITPPKATTNNTEKSVT